MLQREAEAVGAAETLQCGLTRLGTYALAIAAKLCMPGKKSAADSGLGALSIQYEGKPGTLSLDTVVSRLNDKGEELDWMLVEQLNVPSFVGGLQEYCGHMGESIDDYIRHSSRFAMLDALIGSLFTNELVVIPESQDNLTSDGTQRREEEGYRLDLDYVRSNGVNPARVLYFRVTQPAKPGQSKPEYYWTSDLHEAAKGLRQELGPDAETAIILVSTLEDIAGNGGLKSDMNDDCGVPVRQIGLGPYDQSRALFTMPRSICGSEYKIAGQ